MDPKAKACALVGIRRIGRAAIIKEFIKEIVETEDPKSPCSDQAMVEILGEKGINISRRTVAKYRDEMNIASSSKRRRY